MKTKRFLAILIALSMIFAAINVPVFASVDDPTTAETTYLVDNFTARPKISLVYMQPKADYSGTGFAYEEVAKPSTFNVGDTIYVGVKYDNFQQYRTVGADSNGLFSFSESLLFDKNVLVPEPTFLTDNGVNPLNDDWETVINENGGGELFKDVLTSRINVDGSYFKKNGLTYAGFTMQTVMFKDPGVGVEEGIDNAKIIGIATQFSSATKNSGWVNDSFITAIHEFKIKSVPAAGTKVLDFLRQPTDLTISYGIGGATNYKYGNGLSADLAGFTDLDITDVNLFPATYTIEFYNSYDPDTKTYGTQLTGKDITGIKEGDTVADTTDAKMPADSDFTNDDKTKYLSKPLKYIGADGQAHDFDPDTTVLNSTLFASDAADKTTLKVFAEWANGHTVTFHSEYPDGGAEKTVTRTVSPNSPSAIKKTEEPTVGTAGTEDFAIPTGYSFDGWYNEQNGQGTKIVFAEEGVDGTDVCSESNPITDVYANWTQNWKIEFVKVKGSTDSDNAVGNPIYMSPDATDKTVAKPATDPTRDGYKFNGWYYDDATTGTKTAFVPKGETGATEISGNTVIYADWIKQVTVKYYDTKANAQANGSTGLLASETVDENTLYSALKKKPATTDDDTDHPKKYFEGWYNVTGDIKVDFSSTTGKVTADLTVYQNWKDFYKLEFYKEKTDIGGTAYATEYVNPNKATTLATLPTAPTKDNYGFNEWRVYDSSSSTVTSTKFDTNTTVDKDMILVANWTAKITITFHKNEGVTPETTNDVQITPNVNFDGTAPTYTRSGYTFKEWNTESNGSGTAYTSLTSAQFSASDDLYAIWTAAGADQSTLTFNANLTGVTPNPSSVTVNTGDKVYTANIPVVSKDNYKFDGWYESASITDTTKIDFDAGYTVSESKTVYAHWTYTGTDKITVTFMNDSAQYATIDVAPNTTLGDSMPANPKKSGYTFKEWNDSSDGKGSTFDKDTNVGATGPATVTVYAQYVQDITVNYNANGGSNAPASVTKPAGDTYVDPDVTGMSNGTYTFVGWNTKKNSSGTYVPASGTSLTYQAVADLYKDGGTAPTSVTLYAQWAAIDGSDVDDVKTGTPTDPDPTQQGVRVTFADNAPSGITASANPQYKYPQYGDTIGTDNMPEYPTRTNYKCVGWNTKPDGSGVAITATTTFDTNTLGADLVKVDETTTAYTVTAYAQWEVDPDYQGDKVTLTFNKNTDGTGTDANPITKTIVKGDSLGYDITAPINGNYEFVGWYTGDNSTGKVVFGSDKFSSTTTYSADTTFYAKWKMYLLAEPKSTSATYTGQVIKPKYDIYQITYPNGTDSSYVKGSPIATNVDITAADSQYKVTYTNTKDNTTGDLKNVGKYTINVSLKDDSDLKAQGATIAVTEPATFTVTEALLTIKVNPDTQVQKSGDTVPKATITVDGLKDGDVAGNIYDINYYLWADAGDENKDGLIQDSELTKQTADPTAVGKYVVKVEFKDQNPNYKIDKVESSVDGKSVLLYGQTSTTSYPGYPGLYDSEGKLTKVGQNIIYEIQANDPSISGIVVKSADTKDDEGNTKDPEVITNLSLKQSDYKTDETFDNKETPDITNYYIRVTDVGAEEVRFTVTLTNPDTTSLTANGGTVVENADGTYTVTAPLTNKGATANVVTITTKAGDAADAPTITYTFNLQQLVTAKIELGYGNSPYGEIMKDSDITDKDAAKAAFDVNNCFDNNYLPTAAANMYLNGTDRIVYRPEVWTTAGVDNMDKNDTAIFVYNGKAFRDPGFVATDSLGNSVDDSKITRVIKVNRMLEDGVGGVTNVTDFNAADAVATGSLLTYAGTNIDNKYLFTNITTSDPAVKKIRPSVYDMEYSFTDETTGNTVTTTRKVIVLFGTGDTDLSTDISPIDLNAIKVAVGTGQVDITGAPVLTNNLYLHRMMDTDNSGDISPIDLNKIKVTVATGAPIPDYYIPLASD